MKVIKLKAAITHNKINESTANAFVYFIIYIGHPTPKSFNDIVTIMVVIVFLAVIAMLLTTPLCAITALD